MILVTLGTQDKTFNRLLKKIQEQIELGNIKDEVIVQAGCTKFESNNMEIFDLISIDELDILTKKADLIITHGGVGSIISGLKNNKKVIVCPRLQKYDEHESDHQLQITKNFYKEGYIIPFYENDDLEKLLKKAKKFEPKKYKSNTKNMIKLIENYIDNI
ncbi:MAG: exopolysaccharide biosynthesis protein [Bacilli bacterium]|nr:exopolysaccharide biosynthesis protein [Bacilli bacterium]